MSLAAPKLLDVQGGEVPALTIAPTPEEFADRLKVAKFVGKGDHDMVQKLYQTFWFANGVG